MSIINVKNLTFSYEGSYENIFQDVSFQIDSDWKLGFVGRNGKGKTTFLKILNGELNASGDIAKSIEFEYFPFEIKDESEIAYNIILERIPDFDLWEIVRELNLLKVDEDCLYRPFNLLSGGERTKVMLASLFAMSDRFLLIDEPTNHLDIWGRELLAKYLSKKKGFILVSHDRKFLDSTVDHILSINRESIQIQKGNFSSWLENKQRYDNFELATNQKLENEIAKLKNAAKRKTDWSYKAERQKLSAADRGFVGHKAAKVMKTAKAIEKRQDKAIENKSKLLKNIEQIPELKLCTLTHYSETLAHASEFGVAFGQNAVFSNLTFSLNQGDRMSLEGKNGCGKSTLLKFLSGENIPHTGSFSVASGLVVSYVPQDTTKLKGSLRDFILESQIDETLFKTILVKLDFNKTQFESDISSFSAGQKKKLYIARSLCEKAHLYIWDEPLNYIDIFSRIQIENLLESFSPTIIFVEHDREFVERIANKRLQML